MVSFLEVIRNPGDFVFGQRSQHQGFDPTQRRSESIGAWTGGNVRQDREPGYARLAQGDIHQNRYWALYKEAASLIERAMSGDRHAIIDFQEAMSTSDFPQLFGDVIDRAVLANYTETPYTWNMIARRSTVADFRPVKRFRIDGGTGLPTTALNADGTMKPIPEGGPYPEDFITDDQYTYSLKKYGKRMPFFWETLINDDLNALKDTPARFGRGMRRGEEYFVTQLFANNTTFFTAANKNTVVSTNLTAAPPTAFTNPPLTVTGLQQAMLVMASQVDTTGQPISVESFILVVGPGNMVQAKNIINQTDQIIAQTLGGDTNAQGFPNQAMIMRNWLAGSVQIAVNYELPIVDTTYGNKGWYLFANPNSGRPALEFGLLRGHERPELFMKTSNSVVIGEGTMGPGAGVAPGSMMTNPMDGDFDTDAIHYKIRHVFGGTQIDPIMAVYSNGSNA